MDEKPTESNEQQKRSLLYHYTNQNGLLGILESKSIWATHVRYLNDASEFKHGLDMVKDCVKEIALDPKLLVVGSELMPLKNDPILRNLESVVRDSIGEALESIDHVDVFVTSFFSDPAHNPSLEKQDIGDSLGQWRGYSGGSAGFSIGFDEAQLTSYIWHIGEELETPIFSGHCVYSEFAQEQYIRERVSEIGPNVLSPLGVVMNDMRTRIFQDIMAEAKRHLSAKSPEEVFGWAMQQAMMQFRERFEQERAGFSASMISLFTKLVVPPIFMKHTAFSEEREWRIARMSFGPQSETRFREGRSSLIPYIAIPLPLQQDNSSLIRRIVVGPSPNIQEAVAAAKMFLLSRGYKVKGTGESAGIEVVASQIPYRDW